MNENKWLLTKIFAAVAIIAATVFGPTPEFQVARAQTRSKAQATRRYVCPMHPDVTSTRARRCPKCGMALRRVKSVDSAATVGTTTPAKAADGASVDGSAFSSSEIPDVRVYDQNSRELNFYSDLIKGKTVAINFIFTTCTTICPPLTATFRRVQQDLAASVPEATLISISVDPTTDNPKRLNDFAGKFKAGPGWTFVTGGNNEIAALLRALGAAVADKNDHTPMILIGNDASGYWTRAYGLSSPSTLVRAISDAAKHK